MFLVIENSGIAPVESFTMLGLSTARGQADKIGQFGSGAKHGILTAIRHKLNPRIYLGQEELAFYTESGKMGDKAYDKLCYMFRDKCESTSMVLEFGSLDWNGLDMALREFVSNAIDATGDDGIVKVSLRESIKPVDDKTIVAFELTPEVNKFYSELPIRFLRFNHQFADTVVPLGPINKSVPECDKGRIYRKGVFVRTTVHNSLFDYNFGDEVKIDESRNMADYTVSENAAEYWGKADVSTLARIMPLLPTMTDKMFEYHFAGYTLCNTYATSKKKVWAEAYKDCYLDALIYNEHSRLVEMAEKKGYATLYIPSQGWYKALENAGVRTVSNTLKKDYNLGDKGEMPKTAPRTLVTRVNKIWSKLARYELTRYKDCPAVKSFVSMANAGEITMAYHKDGTIYVNEECHRDNAAILIAMAQYITESQSGADIYQFAFRAAATFMAKRK
jgi:hypothetical protein